MSACTACGTDLPENARFCLECGASQTPPSCVGCGVDLPAGARFCLSCGAPQPGAPAAGSPAASADTVSSSVTRRVTSVLFGDLVGFTSVSETRDQEDVRELLSAYFEECRQIIARYGGTVEKFIGDAVMAVWGVPTAHEDDAERSVRAGLELVSAIGAMGAGVGVPDLAMRVGIVTGEVAVTVGTEHEGMVAGDAVNTAARVQAAASPGQVWVDETTRLLTTSAISYVDVGSHAMKGKADPVPLWSVRAVVAGIGGLVRADGLEAPHIGRDRELRLVKELFHGVEETGRAALLVVDGEAGVGKTRLGWEFSKYTDGLRTSLRWHSGRCLSYGEGVAYFALAEAIRGRFLSLRPDDEVGETDEDQRRLMTIGLDEFVSDPTERAWLEPRLGALLGIGAVGSFQREDLFNAWTTLLRRIGNDTDPVVLVIDDAQHADEGLIMFLEYLMAVAAFPVFVLLLARQGLLESRPTLATNRRVTVLHLEALSDEEMGELLDGLVAGVPETVRASLVARAEGLPLFAVETVRSLIDRDLVLPRGGQYVLADPERLDLDALGAPASLQALIAARLDTLDADQRRVVDRASVIGDAFTRRQIETLCPDLADLEDALSGLLRLQILRREQDRLSSEVGHYQFVQSAVRQVAYGTLSRRDRKASHLAVVAMLEQDDNSSGELSPILAQHLIEAIDAVAEAPDCEELAVRAVTALREAAARSSSLGSPVEAAAHLAAALNRSLDAGQGASIERELAQHLLWAGRPREALRHAEHAVAIHDELGDAGEAGRGVAVMAGALHVQGRYEEGKALATERYRQVCERGDLPEVELELCRYSVQVSLHFDEDMLSLLIDNLRLAEFLGDEGAMLMALQKLSTFALYQGSRRLAQVLMAASARIARETHDNRGLAHTLTNLTADLVQADAREAAEVGSEAVEVARSVGDHGVLSGAALNLLLARVCLGEWDEALALLEGELIEELLIPYAELCRGHVLRARGQEWTHDARLSAPSMLTRTRRWSRSAGSWTRSARSMPVARRRRRVRQWRPCRRCTGSPPSTTTSPWSTRSRPTCSGSSTTWRHSGTSWRSSTSTRVCARRTARARSTPACGR